jgi:hypothetical protein
MRPTTQTVIPNEVRDLLFLASVFVGRGFSPDIETQKKGASAPEVHSSNLIRAAAQPIGPQL